MNIRCIDEVGQMAKNAWARTATVILLLEGLAVMALAVWQIVALLGGDIESVSSAIALVVTTVVAGGAVLAFAWGVARNQSWSRSGGIVTQLLVLAVAAGALTGSFGSPVIAAIVAIPALVACVALVGAVRAANADQMRTIEKS